jgi:hypothetical protein
MTLVLMRILPWVTRYFVVSNVEVDTVKPGLATLIRKKGRLYSYLYMTGEMDGKVERIPDTDYFWGPWLSVDMRKSPPMAREIDELESFVMIRRASVAQKTVSGHQSIER